MRNTVQKFTYTPN